MPIYRPLEERFWEKVGKQDSLSSCWPWLAARKKDGYGIIGVNGKALTAHRMMWMLLYGRIRKGLHVLHNCDNAWCVNPTHLRLGTHQENMRDAAERSIWHTREQRGEKNASAKLRTREVRRIRRLIKDGTPQKTIALRFGVSRATICRIHKGTLWASF